VPSSRMPAAVRGCRPPFVDACPVWRNRRRLLRWRSRPSFEKVPYWQAFGIHVILLPAAQLRLAAFARISRSTRNRWSSRRSRRISFHSALAGPSACKPASHRPAQPSCESPRPRDQTPGTATPACVPNAPKPPSVREIPANTEVLFSASWDPPSQRIRYPRKRVNSSFVRGDASTPLPFNRLTKESESRLVATIKGFLLPDFSI